ncbi:hypothetical protein SERLA73DRAFT_41847, partial [Serpula lacrymans var. lacrymans S7.3]
KFIKGNVVILPQDTIRVRNLLPPSPEEIEQSVTALFVKADTTVNQELIGKLHPVLVSKCKVKTLLEFLIANNPWYRHSGVQISDQNLTGLYTGSADGQIPHVIAFNFVPPQSAGNSATSRYSVCKGHEASASSADPDFVLDAVGYTTGNHSPASYRIMKATALASCLDGNWFLQL